MSKNPWMKFYPADWRADPRLKMCSLAARGLWIEIICLMHESEPYGHLLVSGLPPTNTQLAVLVGTPPDQLSDLLGELEQVGVFSRTRKGVIYSRKMTRDNKKSVTARKNGQNGGNPSLRKQTGNSSSDNPQVKGQDKPQKPEARSQRLEEEKREDKSSQKKGSRLPENWVLPKDWGEWAIKQGWTEQAIRDQADNFRDYWIAESGAKAVKRDWFATWRVWMRRSGKRLKPIQGGGDGKPSKSEQRAMAFIAGAVGEPPGVDRGEGLDPSQPLLARR